jgi:hypothetical protein
MGNKNEILLWGVLKNRMPVTVSIFLGLKYSVNTERMLKCFVQWSTITLEKLVQALCRSGDYLFQV